MKRNDSPSGRLDARTTVTLICLALLGLPHLLQAQAIQPSRGFEHITVDAGLVDNYLRDILQDSRGFLWIASSNGLSRYDGYGFTNFSLGGVWVVYEDQAGRIWAGAYGGGLNKFNPETQTFTQFLHDPGNPNSLSHNTVSAIHEFSSEPGVLWVATDGGGLNRFDTRDESFIHYRHDPNNPNSLAQDVIASLYEDDSGNLWVTTGNGLSRMRRAVDEQGRQRPSFQSFLHDPASPNTFGGNNVQAVCQGENGDLWIGTGDAGLRLMDGETGRISSFRNDPDDPTSLSNDAIRAIFKDRAGNIWIGTYGGGLNKLDRATKTFIRFMHDPDDPYSLSHNIIRAIHEDRTGVLWVGTYGGGLNKVSQNKFEVYRHKPNNPNSLAHNNVTALCEDSRGALWVGSSDAGLTRIVWRTNGDAEYTHFQHNPGNPNSLADNNITAIHESRDKPGELWIGTFRGGLHRLDSRGGRVERFRKGKGAPGGLDAPNITQIHQSLTDENILWIGTYGLGLYRLDKNTLAFAEFKPDGSKENDPDKKIIRCIYESPNDPGTIWCSGDRGGMWGFKVQNDGNEDRFVLVEMQAPEANNREPDEIRVILDAGNGSFWLGTDNGLSLYNPSTGFLKNFSAPNRQFSKSNGVIKDGNGALWISSTNGFSRFDPQTERFYDYHLEDGLQGVHFNRNAALKGRDGRLYFGGLNGLNVFHPDSIRDNKHIPPIAITDFRIFNKPVKIDPERADEDLTLPAHISMLDEIVLSYRENVFSFEFAALDFTVPSNNQYAYKLEGFQQEWIDAGITRTASFMNLKPGEYTFHVKGSNNDHIWNEEGASIKITILPPWWRTWWAYGFYVIFIGAALYVLRRYEKNRQRFKHRAELHRFEREKLQEVDHLKSRFFANISHEFRTPLTLIMGQVDSELESPEEKKNKSKLQMISRNAEKLLTLINQLLDLSKFEAGQMTLKASQQNVVPLLRYLVSAFESWAAQKRISLQFESSHDEILLWYEQEKIEKVMYNLLSNALKFTPEGGKVSVQLSVISDQLSAARLNTEHSLLITVRDSGIGIPRDRLPHIFDRFYQVDSSQTREFEGTGIGLALSKELVQLHGGGISVQSTEGFGSTFTVTLPLGYAHLKPEQIAALKSKKQEANSKEQIMGDGGEYPVISVQPAATSDQSERSGDPDSSGQPATSIEPQVSSIQEQATSDLHPATSNEFILIVEDNADMRAFIGESLREEYRIVEAANGDEGFVKAQEYSPDLIITDVMMPRVDGYEMTRRIRQDQITSHIPIIMLTAKAADEDKFAGLEQGVDAYLTKPFNKKELRIRVRKLIELRKNLRQKTGTKAVLTPSEIEATSMEQEFLQRVRDLIEANMENEDFSVDELARKIGMGERQLLRKLKALTDSSPQQCIRSMRLQRARQLLEQSAGTVPEIAYQVGYGNVKSFGRAFREEFGMVPSEVIPKNKL